MKRILSYLFLSSCLFLSCNTDESDELLLSANVKVENADDVSMFDTGNEQVVIPDSVAFFNTIMPLAAVEKKSEISPYVYDYKVMSDIGYDRIEYSMHNQTINLTNKYSGEALRTLGLPQSIYIVDVLRVYKTLSSYKPKAKILPKDPDASLMIWEKRQIILIMIMRFVVGFLGNIKMMEMACLKVLLMF